jgi:DNA-binding HxlR family transcriptional regulator
MPHNSNFCADFHKAVELIGRRWSGAIVREMLAGASRFTEIRDAIPDLSERMLCARLKELEVAGVLSRVVHAEPSARVEYLLTPKGRSLEPVFVAIGAWADRYVHRPEQDCQPEQSEGAMTQGTPPSLRSG